jgi:hypothetical protein
LTRHDSRFYFSHEFQYCPLNDLMKALKNKKLTSIVMYDFAGEKYHYLENCALHYLCRPTMLENLSCQEFYENYQVAVVKNRPRKHVELATHFICDTGFFKHPSASKGTHSQSYQCCQGATLRPKGSLNIQVSQWSFPDTGCFHGNILTCEEEKINQDMEKLAFSMLTLFHSYRFVDDLKPFSSTSRTPCVKQLRKIYGNKILSVTCQNQSFLIGIWIFYRTSRTLLTTVYGTRLEKTCTMPKRQAVVIFPEVNYELSLVMENVKRESWRQSTSSPKIGILVLIMHTAWSPNTSS